VRDGRLLREFNGLQIASPDLVSPAGDPTVEGRRAPDGKRDRLALPQLDLRPYAVALGVRRAEVDPGDVLERHAEATPPELALEARISTRRHTIHVHVSAIHVYEGRVEIARRCLRLAAPEAPHPEETDGKAAEDRCECDASNRLTHVPSQRVGTDARRGLSYRLDPLGSTRSAISRSQAVALTMEAQSRLNEVVVPRVLGIVMAGGRGDRLQPLTRSRSKAAVPFGSRHRIIDYVLSNFVNSGIYAIYLLVQYKSQSLIEHVSTSWRLGGRLPETFVTVVPPQMRSSETWYQGTADAVFQNLNLIQDFAPELVVVFGADHIYRMDLGQMIDYHVSSRCDVSVAARPVPLGTASAFGVIASAPDGRIVGFAEKPRSPEAMPGDPGAALASMGNYVFSTEVLVDTLCEDARRPTEHDFGRTIVPELVSRHRVFAYNFRDNRVPGARPYEEPAYWRDVGAIRAYYDAQMDQLGTRPKFDLDNPRWPILGRSVDGPPVRIISGHVQDSMLGEGSFVEEARVVRSILGRGVRVARGAVVEGSIVMDYTEIGAGARVVHAIVDRYNRIPPGGRLEPEGGDVGGLALHRDPSGIVVVSRGEPAGPLPQAVSP